MWGERGLGRRVLRSAVLVISAFLGAAEFSPLYSEAAPQPVASLFAPEAKKKESTVKVPARGRKTLAPAPQPQVVEPEPEFISPPKVDPPQVTVDDRGNQLLIIEGADPPDLNDFIADPLAQVSPEPSPIGASSPSPFIVVDEAGNKTLVIKGDISQASPAAADSNKVLKIESGSDASSIVIDGTGKKTLVIKGDGDKVRGSGGVNAAASDSPQGLSPWHKAAEAPVEEKAAEKPYWIKAAEPESAKPYFQEAAPMVTEPYWKVHNQSAAEPYWKVDTTARDDRYWLAKKEKEKPPANKTEVTSATKAGFAPAASGEGAPGASANREVSFFTFKDENGVVHASNVPSDSRYRLVTFSVVEFKVQRGLSGTRTRLTPEGLRTHILRAAVTYNLDPALIAAIIKSESAFDANAVSWAGAQGLMQLMPATARDVGCRDPFDPEDNIMGGSRYIRWMLDRFNGNLDLAIAAYNCGPTRVAREWRIPNIPETQNYVVIVKRNYMKYRNEF